MMRALLRLLRTTLDPLPPTQGVLEPGVPAAEPAPVNTYQLDTIRPHFDAAFYLKSNPDVAEAGVDPVAHFLTIGWREGRDPTADFDVGHYLLANSDVEAAGINPFYHYIVAGKDEGRTPNQKHRWRRDAVMTAAPPPRPTVKWRANAVTSHDTCAALKRATAGAQRIVLSVSHDRYAITPGGVQNCIADEQRQVTAAGDAHVHVAPEIPLHVLSPATAADEIGLHLTVDGVSIGTVTARDLIDHMAAEPKASGSRLIVHHLLGHSPEVIATIAAAMQAQTTYWTHDFFSLCESYALLRNNLAFCGAPPVGSTACRICIHGRRRAEHAARIARFIEETGAEIVAPSKAALDMLVAGGLSAPRMRVVPHGHIAFSGERPRTEARLPLKVAFVGLPVTHKGWPAFAELARVCRASNAYDFVQIGSRRGESADVRYIPISVTPADRGAMVRALEDEDIDIVVNWTLCHETFSFVTHEAIAAGTFVIVPTWAGHAARVVAEEEAGWVAPSLEDLFDAFVGETIVARYQERRAAGLKTGTFNTGQTDVGEIQRDGVERAMGG